mgnify:CR=1 FL=1
MQKCQVINSGKLKTINVSFIARRAVPYILKKVRDYNYPRFLIDISEYEFLPGYRGVFVSVEDSEIIFVKE